MGWQALYSWSKKLHRFLLWFVTILGLWMMLSGFLMHQEIEGRVWFSSESMQFVRLWHNNISQYFLIVLLLQMVTGLLMWAIPKILQARIKA